MDLGATRRRSSTLCCTAIRLAHQRCRDPKAAQSLRPSPEGDRGGQLCCGHALRRPLRPRLAEDRELRLDTLEPTGVVIAVHEAAFLQPFRERYLQRPGVTIPPHVTVCSPFLAVGAINMAVRTRLHEVCAASEGFTFTLARTDRFVDPGVLYLVPQPTQELEKLNHAIRLAFEFELGPRPVFHMTLAGWHPAELDSIEKAFHDCHAGQLPDICTRERSVALPPPGPSLDKGLGLRIGKG